MDIPVVENVRKLNDEIARGNRGILAEAGVACVNLMGSPGCGKTALLEFRAQKEGNQEEIRGLQRLRNQVTAILAAQDSRGDDDDPARVDQDALLEAQKALGLEGAAGSEREQLEQVLAKANLAVADGFEPSFLNGKELSRAGTRPPSEQSPSWAVTLSFNPEGAQKFADLTQSIAGTGRLLGIFLDGSPISTASVGPQFEVAGITGGNAEITGGFSAEQAADLAELINGGALPLPVKILQVRTIGPTLGAENVQRSLVAALSGLAYGAAYSASKGGVSALTRTLAVEFAKRGVRCNAVNPGSIKTPMTAAGAGLPEDADIPLVLRHNTLDEPRGPEEVASLIAFLASSEAAHITGEEVRVDGGALS